MSDCVFDLYKTRVLRGNKLQSNTNNEDVIKLLEEQKKLLDDQKEQLGFNRRIGIFNAIKPKP